MALSQSLKQKMTQKLSPQQIQLMKLLQVPTAHLEVRIQQELESNPALEEGNDNDSDNDSDSDFNTQDDIDGNNETDDNQDYEDSDMDGGEDEYDKIDISEYVSDSDDDDGDYRYQDSNEGASEVKEMPYRAESTFFERLKEQLLMLDLDDRQRKIAEQIIGTIDDDGYIRRPLQSLVDDLAFRQNVVTDEEEVERILKMIQTFDPPGLGARNLKECLLLQLNQKDSKDRTVKLATEIIKDYFDEFIKKHYDKIEKSFGLDDDELKKVMKVITRLNPKPGGEMDPSDKMQSYVVPDFFVFNDDGELKVTLNSKNAPYLRISGDYKDMLKDYDKSKTKDKKQREVVLFIKQKIDSAKWFIDAIKQRQHTLISTMETIVKYQERFFLTGEETDMKPMILKNIADRTGLDISTISRVANSKFVQTEYGTFRLKYFFSESLVTDTGEEVSTREVKKILSDLIDDEDKSRPLSDEKLTEALQDKGYNIARRTVAKYRQQLNIPVARLRKQL